MLRATQPVYIHSWGSIDIRRPRENTGVHGRPRDNPGDHGRPQEASSRAARVLTPCCKSSPLPTLPQDPKITLDWGIIYMKQSRLIETKTNISKKEKKYFERFIYYFIVYIYIYIEVP